MNKNKHKKIKKCQNIVDASNTSTGRLAEINWDMMISLFTHTKKRLPNLAPRELQAVVHFLHLSVSPFQVNAKYISQKK